MYKEVIKNATPEQFYKNVYGRLYTLSLNQAGGMDCYMYCFIKDIETKDQKIKDLEHRLSNCIEPKFKVGQIVWHCYKNCNAPVKTVIESIDIEVNKEFVDFTYYDVAGFGFDEIMLFTTEAEAKKHLEELKK